MTSLEEKVQQSLVRGVGGGEGKRESAISELREKRNYETKAVGSHFWTWRDSKKQGGGDGAC